MSMGMFRGSDEDIDEDFAFESMRDNSQAELDTGVKDLIADLRQLSYYEGREEALKKDLLKVLLEELNISKEELLCQMN